MSLVGLHVEKVVSPGRTFVSRMYGVAAKYGSCSLLGCLWFLLHALTLILVDATCIAGVLNSKVALPCYGNDGVLEDQRAFSYLIGSVFACVLHRANIIQLIIL